ncbi:hypothetical protein [Marivita sp.]|uniref:hypothetical protein n=1 Tax=Marivita sp. TaxID=2003365 RepID=UPI0025BAE67D|nr:hypothetical protein [Marivita sp.]
MAHSDVTVISLVIETTGDRICPPLEPVIAQALGKLGIRYQQMPAARDYVDWLLNETDTLTVAADEVDAASVIVVAYKGPDTHRGAVRLANIGADLCAEFNVHTVFWNSCKTPIAVADFLRAGDRIAQSGDTPARIVPRKVQASNSVRADLRRKRAKIDAWMLSAIRAQMNAAAPSDLGPYEMDNRRVTSAPLRLAAWSLSFATAIIALPLAFPLIMHNALRGENLRAATMSLGVAGLYAGLAQSGLAPGLTDFL